MNKNKTLGILVCGGLLLVFLFSPLSTKATTTSTPALQEFIQELREQIEELQRQILELQEQLVLVVKNAGEIKKEAQEIRQTLRITRQLDLGMRNEEIRLLQEILATDPEIYPEGLITGYFGPLTERAVKRFQERMGVEKAGRVGPKTLSKINELLEEGAGSSGKVPPGLLIAPGIKKKIGYTPQPLAGQKLPPGIQKKLGETATSTEEDIEAPVISEVKATSTKATSTRIIWTTDEKADSKVWYDTVSPLVITTSTLSVSSSNLETSHDLPLTGLTASTTYYYLVASSDETGNAATGTENSFTTLGE